MGLLLKVTLRCVWIQLVWTMLFVIGIFSALCCDAIGLAYDFFFLVIYVG